MIYTIKSMSKTDAFLTVFVSTAACACCCIVVVKVVLLEYMDHVVFLFAKIASYWKA